MVLLGAIADDLTGATDLAIMLKREGMRVVQVIGVPDPQEKIPDADSVVVALKTRTAPVQEAVSHSLESIEWLEKGGAHQFFFKYSSTFDSTKEGNIGPVIDALLHRLDEKITIACPAFPTNGRTVYQGHLFVGDNLLSESSMRNHPLTPMTDSDLRRLLQQQSRCHVGLIPLSEVSIGPKHIADALDSLKDDAPSIAIVDAITDEHIRAIGKAGRNLKLITGGSGISMGLPDNFKEAGLLNSDQEEERFEPPEGPTVILAGSCSAATLGQIAHARERLPHYRLDPLSGGDPKSMATKALEWSKEKLTDGTVMISSSDSPESVKQVQEKLGRFQAGAKIEAAFGQIALGLREMGIRRFIVAGGETSGAVVDALGIRGLRIGPEIDPGVPWTISLGAEPIALALKSGNFGAPNFFSKAMEMRG